MTILLQGAGLQATNVAVDIGAILRAKATAYYKLDDSGVPWKDAKGSNDLIDGVELGGDPVLSAAGKVNNSASFAMAGNGTTLYHVSNSDFTLGDVSFAVVAWIWLDDKNPVGYTIISKQNNNDTEWAIGYRAPLEIDPQGDRYMGFMLGADSSYPGIIYPLTPINLHEWHMVALWYDANADLLSMRIDNGAVETFAWAGGTPETTSAFGIGGSLTASGGATVSDFDGRVDEVLWIKGNIVTTDELDYLYNSGAGRALFPAP